MGHREIPQVNMGSMADIAFLLLIFFLVATTLDMDSGLLRVLPQPVPEDLPPPPPMRERNVLVVLTNKDNLLMVEHEITDIKDLKDITKEFLLNENNSDELPEKRIKDIKFIGEMEVTKGIISLQTDRTTSYDLFISVLNEILAAGNEIKNDFSMQHFKKPFDELEPEKRKAVLDAVPCIISEAEPRNVGED